MDTERIDPDDKVIYIPDELIRSIDRVINTLEKAQREFLNERNEKNEGNE